MRAVAICLILLTSACAGSSEPPKAGTTETRCEALLRATMLDSIDRDETCAKTIGIERAGRKAAEGRASANEAWARWGPLGVAAAAVATAIAVIVAAVPHR